MRKFGEVIHTIQSQSLHSQLDPSIEAVTQNSSNKPYSVYLIYIYIYIYI